MKRIIAKAILLIFSCAAITSCAVNKSRSQTNATNLEQDGIFPFSLEKSILDSVDCMNLFEPILPSGACIYSAEVTSSSRLRPIHLKVTYRWKNDIDCMKEKINNGDLKAESLLLNFIQNEYNYYNKHDKNQGQCNYLNGLEDMRSTDSFNFLIKLSEKKNYLNDFGGDCRDDLVALSRNLILARVKSIGGLSSNYYFFTGFDSEFRKLSHPYYREFGQLLSDHSWQVLYLPVILEKMNKSDIEYFGYDDDLIMTNMF